MSPVPAGERRHLVEVQNPDGPPQPNGAGGYTQAYVAADPPTLYVAIQSATAPDLERVTSGTVVSMSTHLILGPYHPGLTTKSRLVFLDHGRTRIFNVVGPSTPGERGIDSEVQVAEVVT
jgi:hypothetical protein